MRILLLSLFSVCCFVAHAAVRLPWLVRDSMVLQRDRDIHVWGWADAGEKVKIRFHQKKYSVTAGKDGKWELLLAPMKAGGPYTMQVDASNHVTLRDILIGDVWVCAGQSNMVHQLALHSERYAAEIASANNAMIRQFLVPYRNNFEGPLDDYAAGSWKAATSEHIRQFSAVAYFFACKIYEQYKVPVGIINASVGGTPIEAWMSEEGIQPFQDMSRWREAHRADFSRPAAPSPEVELLKRDKGLQVTPWYDTGFQPKDWRHFDVPGYWEDQGIKELDGVVWFRKTITVRAGMLHQPAMLALGRMVDADRVYVNGKNVGSTGYQYPQRRYALAADVLTAGKNVITIRISNYSGKGGFVPDKPYYLAVGRDTIDLKGSWSYKVGAALPREHVAGSSFSAQNSPTVLYNAMLAPATAYMIKGFAWYQGETNAGEPEQYSRLLPALIEDWRRQWKQGVLPFVYVQLPNFMEVQYQPSESTWAATREAQRKTLSVANTGMAVTIDLGEWNDIHPDRKKEVGERLALQALKLAYGEKNLVASGPVLASAVRENNRIVLQFSNTGSGLVARDGGTLQEFAIAGSNKQFVWAQASITGDKVVVWNDTVTNPLYVRYAWADNPDNPNLYNREGLPASPFETDAVLPAVPGKGLKDYYKDYFPVGVAVSPQALETDEAGLVLREFNSLTPENAMKMAAIHPAEDRYYWREADSIVAFAVRHGLKVRGHTLCWHNQAPDWLWKDAKGDTVSKAVLLQRLKAHITTVVKRYKGKVYAWDVVNEAISDKADEYLRPSPWLRIAGEEYIAKAFQWAHEADPDALLFYNDYNEINLVKRKKILRLITGLKQAGIPIHGVGLQAHWAITEPTRPQLDSTLAAFVRSGLQVQITELDLSVYPKEHTSRERRPEDAAAVYSAELEARQAAQYQMCFELFRKYRQHISGVTFWNISDRYSWLDYFPVKNRKDYPLLFDKDLQPKRAYRAVTSFAQQAGTYANPVLAGFYPDPSVCRVGNDYYLVNSSFAYYPGLPLFHSTDLVHWKQIGHAMDRPEQLNTLGAGVSRGLFAPAISYHKGVFYIVCTLIDKGGNFVITATNPAGPWSNPVWLKEVNGIDPSLFFDQDDRAYIVYNSDPPGNQSLWSGHRSIRIRSFDYRQLRTTGEEQLIVNGGTDTARHPVWIEGPHLYYINGWYYLLCAEGGTGDNHSEVVFRSKTVNGPFQSYAGNPILTQRQLNPARVSPITTTGHADLVQTPEGNWYAVFLGCRPYEPGHYNIGRETFLAPVSWTTDGWPVITEGNELVQSSYPLPVAALGKHDIPAYSGAIRYRNDFGDPIWDPRLIFLRTVTEPWYNTTGRKGYLSMQLRPETVSGAGNPSFVGFRQQQHTCTASTALSFTALAANEKAGLVIFQSEQHFYYLCQSTEGGKPVVQLYQSTAGGDMQLLASAVLNGLRDQLYLRISQSGADYHCAYSLDNSKWAMLGTVDARFLSTKTAGGFVGSVFGLYATSLGQRGGGQAYFDWFSYSGQ